MNGLKSRVSRLERDRASTGLEVWRQDAVGRDRYTSTQHPELAFTRAELDDFLSDFAGTLIVVERTTPAPRPEF